MNRAELDRFNRQAASNRNELFGTLAAYDGGTAFRIAISGFRSGKQLEDGGFQFEHDAVGRAERWPGLFFELGKKIFVPHTGKTYRIDEIVDHPINPEWRLGLKEL